MLMMQMMLVMLMMLMMSNDTAKEEDVTPYQQCLVGMIELTLISTLMLLRRNTHHQCCLIDWADADVAALMLINAD